MSVNDYFLCPPIPSQFIILRTLPLSLLHRILLCIHPWSSPARSHPDPVRKHLPARHNNSQHPPVLLLFSPVFLHLRHLRHSTGILPEVLLPPVKWRLPDLSGCGIVSSLCRLEILIFLWLFLLSIVLEEVVEIWLLLVRQWLAKYNEYKRFSVSVVSKF